MKGDSEGGRNGGRQRGKERWRGGASKGRDVGGRGQSGGKVMNLSANHAKCGYRPSYYYITTTTTTTTTTTITPLFDQALSMRGKLA
ncbi:hypothetical protein E2C01_091555 [Portunus trituberculatus]|uniref:Uncharacterized protein n=1 Tax=Portunus trituberculatus TaxID=210409 RepID=A0A5B7JVC4_PORTR|nr:hypothetical protein [Portunus trituberculatus]